MNKIGDVGTLLQVANAWEKFPITSLEQAEAFLNRLHDATGGWVILDFLDAANWDCFESFSTNHDTGMLQINWHDFIEQDKQSPRAGDREMMAMAFPASLYSVAMRFDCLDRLGDDRIAFFALRGYSVTDKETRRFLSTGTEEFVVRRDRPFSLEVLRKVDGHIEVIDCITNAAFTMLIVPKRTRIPAHASKALLYQHNLALVNASLARSEQALLDMQASDPERICEKANTIRRNMETVLKLECCFREIEMSKPYSQSRIGDLWGLLKAYHTEGTQTLVSRFVQWANELSHDTGIPIERCKAQLIALIARMYVELLTMEISRDYRQPWLRPRDEEYVAF